MAWNKDTLVWATYFIRVYAALFIVVVGWIGNAFNILVFTQVKQFRRNQSAFYLVVSSMIDSWELAYALIQSIFLITLNNSLTEHSLFLCKIGAYINLSKNVMSAIIICLASIDQYLSTNHYAPLRQMSTLKLAQRLVCILILFSSLYCIPLAIFHEIRQDTECTIFDAGLTYYYSFVHNCLLFGLIPIFVSSILSILAYNNVRRLVRRHMSVVRRRMDRQLTAMILLRVALFIVTTLPHIGFEMYEIYNPIIVNNTDNAKILTFLDYLLSAVHSLDHLGAFYVFLISSSRFRRQIRCILVKMIKCTCFLQRTNRNQVVPINALEIVEQISSVIQIAE